MAPVRLTVVAWLYLSACFCCAGIIGYDIAVNHRRQPMGVMNAVYPITALYFGPLALALYWHWGRAARGAAMSLSRTSVSNAAAASGGDRRYQPGGAHARHDQASTAGPGGADQPARLLRQVGMIIGYFTSWPASVWLINRGSKVPM